MSKTVTDICMGDAEREWYLRFGATRGFWVLRISCRKCILCIVDHPITANKLSGLRGLRVAIGCNSTFYFSGRNHIENSGSGL